MYSYEISMLMTLNLLVRYTDVPSAVSWLDPLVVCRKVTVESVDSRIGQTMHWQACQHLQPFNTILVQVKRYSAMPLYSDAVKAINGNKLVNLP